MKKLLAALLFTCMVGFSYHVSASTIDFISVADGTGTVYGVTAGERGYDSVTFTPATGPTVTATGTYITANYEQITDDYAFGWVDITHSGYAYLDAGNAGLGVCQKLKGAAQCDPNSDDNVTYNETLRLVFSETVTLNSVTFKNGNHGIDFADDADFVLNGDTFSLINIFDVPGANGVGTVFEFHNPNFLGGSNVSNNYQFYIAELDYTIKGITPEVPIPPAIWLFGSGLVGMIGIARRRKHK